MVGHLPIMNKIGLARKLDEDELAKKKSQNMQAKRYKKMRKGHSTNESKNES